jgi:hypothetical protein
MARNPRIWVSSTGERWYPIEMLASMLGVKPAEVRRLISVGAIPPGQPRGGGSTLFWPEWSVAQLQRLAKPAGGVFPYA